MPLFLSSLLAQLGAGVILARILPPARPPAASSPLPPLPAAASARANERARRRLGRRPELPPIGDQGAPPAARLARRARELRG